MKKLSAFWQQKRDAVLSSKRFKKAFAAALAKRRKHRCAHGHDLSDPDHAHVGDLFRTGHLTCWTCWRAQSAAYVAEAAEPRKRKAKKPISRARKAESSANPTPASGAKP
jgi:hypothetical protein